MPSYKAIICQRENKIYNFLFLFTWMSHGDWLLFGFIIVDDYFKHKENLLDGFKHRGRMICVCGEVSLIVV